MQIRHAAPGDAVPVAEIYNPYVTDTCITFETEPVTAAEMATRIRETADAGLPWLVAIDQGSLVGYAYASRWKGRCAYRYSVESTVYLSPSGMGKRIGHALYQALVDRLRSQGIHTVIGGIALPNERSIALHERMGFQQVARFGQVGFKHDRWIDVGYWQLVFDDAVAPPR